MNLGLIHQKFCITTAQTKFVIFSKKGHFIDFNLSLFF